jgi:hypothetical protein
MKLPLLSVLVVGVLLGVKPAHAQSYQAASEGQQVSVQGEIPDALVQTDEDLDGRGGGFHGPGRFVPPHGGGEFHWGGPRQGYRPGHWDRAWRPRWWHPGFVFAPFVWLSDVPVGYTQCTAFNQQGQAFSDIGSNIDEASYDALYSCGGQDYQQNGSGCYIPDGYCQGR